MIIPSTVQTVFYSGSGPLGGPYFRAVEFPFELFLQEQALFVQFEVSRTCFLSWAAECWALPFFVCPHCWYLLGLFRSDRLLLLPHTFLTTLVSLFIMPQSLFPLCLSSFSQCPTPVFCFTFLQFWYKRVTMFLMSSLFLSFICTVSQVSVRRGPLWWSTMMAIRSGSQQARAPRLSAGSKSITTQAITPSEWWDAKCRPTSR